ncbi:unnamed protein product [Protopolystoma xenopodis]|uniref:MARVEL domain-containing protein n=1 Tax=Protopolystoma xenopodis TaxID=117903 RepID=A0A448WLD5_9PLAT|nr:unnamed protein product [Protopolystoma xenopodis]
MYPENSVDRDAEGEFPPNMDQDFSWFISWKPQLPPNLILIIFPIAYFLTGLLAFVTEIVTLSIHLVPSSHGTGIWFGLFSFVAGALGCVLTAKRTKSMTVLCLVTDSLGICASVIAAVFGNFGTFWAFKIDQVTIAETRNEQFAVMAAGVIAVCFYVVNVIIICVAMCKKH